MLGLGRSISEIKSWFQKTKIFWTWMVITCAVLWVGYSLPGTLSDRLRWASAFFEAMGITAVVVGIERRRHAFGKQSMFKDFLLAAGDVRYIFMRRPPISGTLNAQAEGDTLTAYVTVSRAKGSTVEERLSLLEAREDQSEKNVNDLRSALATQKTELLTEIKKEEDARKAADNRAAGRVEETMIGDNWLEIAGVAYLYVGLILAGLSNEIASGLIKFGFF